MPAAARAWQITAATIAVACSFALSCDQAGAADCSPSHSIAEIQGRGSESPVKDQRVVISGVVTAVIQRGSARGYFLQMPGAGDGDPATSDGIFVFTGNTSPGPDIAVGHGVCVAGTVIEYRPSQDLHSPPLTQITRVTGVSVIRKGQPLPAAVTISRAHLNPAGGLEQLERLEGMRVRVGELRVVSPTVASEVEATGEVTSTGIFYGVVNGTPRPFREPGIRVPDPLPAGAPPGVPRFDGNPERLRVWSGALAGTFPIDVSSGAKVSGLTGPLTYAFRTYTVVAEPGARVSGGMQRARLARKPGRGEFRVASANLERLFDAQDDPNRSDIAVREEIIRRRLAKMSLVFRTLLRCPEIVGVQEVENISILRALAAQINRDAVGAGDEDPRYEAWLEEGNDPGGIDVGFLARTGRVRVESVRQEGKAATYVNAVSGAKERLNDRPPLVLRAEVGEGARRAKVAVVVNHLRSLRGVESPVDGPRVWAKRAAQAEYLAQLHQSLQEEIGAGGIAVSLGDFNAFEFSDGYVDVVGTVTGTPARPENVVVPTASLVKPEWVNLVLGLPPSQRYSYLYDGNSQVLDHVLVSKASLPYVTNFEYVRSNSDYPGIWKANSSRPERISDHDIPIATFRLWGR
jgi:uncharacterized protein